MVSPLKPPEDDMILACSISKNQRDSRRNQTASSADIKMPPSATYLFGERAPGRASFATTTATPPALSVK